MDTLSLASLIVGLVTSAWGLHTAYRASVRKRYAAERDFSELRDSYATLSAGLVKLGAECDRRFDLLDQEMREAKVLLQVYTLGARIDRSKLD